MTIPFLVLSIFFLFSSFAFGCTESWAITTCEGILFLGTGIASLADVKFLQWPQKLNIFALFVVLLIAISLLQLIPIPVSIYNVLDRERIENYTNGAKAEELLQSEKYRIDPFEKTEIPYESQRYTPKVPSFLTITRTPFATLRALIALFSFFCFLLLLEDVMRQGNSELRKLALFVGLIGFAVGVIAIIEKGIEHRTHILWLRESSRAQNAFGPFVNANHGAAFINLTFPIIYYLLWRKVKRETKISEKAGLVLLTSSLILMQVALIISGFSYGNYLILLILPLFILFNFSLRLKNKLLIATSTVFALFILFGITYLFFSGAVEFDTKRIMFQNAMQNWSFIGMGVNSFSDTFPTVVIRWPVIQPFKIEYLENEYLQVLYEGGVLPFICAIFVAVNVLFVAAKNLSSRRSLFWLSAPLFAETIRVFFDMSFHIFPLSAVFVLLFSLSLKEG